MTVYVVTSCEGSYEETYYYEYYNNELEAKIRCYHLNKEDKIVWETYDFITIYDKFCPKWSVRKIEAGPPQAFVKVKTGISQRIRDEVLHAITYGTIYDKRDFDSIASMVFKVTKAEYAELVHDITDDPSKRKECFARKSIFIGVHGFTIKIEVVT